MKIGLNSTRTYFQNMKLIEWFLNEIQVKHWCIIEWEFITAQYDLAVVHPKVIHFFEIWWGGSLNMFLCLCLFIFFKKTFMCDVIRVYHWVVVYHCPVDDCSSTHWHHSTSNNTSSNYTNLMNAGIWRSSRHALMWCRPRKVTRGCECVCEWPAKSCESAEKKVWMDGLFCECPPKKCEWLETFPWLSTARAPPKSVNEGVIQTPPHRICSET